MATIVNNAEIRVTTTGTDQAKAQINSLKKTLNEVAKTALGFAGVAQGFRLLWQTLGNVAKESEQAQQAMNKLGLMIANTGRSAEISASALSSQAEALSALSNFDDEDILLNVTTNLMKFSSIASSQLPKATEVAVDLAEAMGGGESSLAGAAKVLGIALEKPQMAISKFLRAGVTFTPQQEQMIRLFDETGRKAEAQAIILDAVGSSFNGLAFAMQTSSTKMRNAWYNFLETLDNTSVIDSVKTSLASFFTSITKNMNTSVNTSRQAAIKHQQTAARVGIYTRAVLTAIGGVFATVGDVLKSIGTAAADIARGLIKTLWTLISAPKRLLEGENLFKIYADLPKQIASSWDGSFARATATLNNNIKNWTGLFAGLTNEVAISDATIQNAFDNIDKLRELSFDDEGGGGGGLGNPEAAKAMSDAIKQLSVDMREYFLSVNKYTGSGSALFDELAEKWSRAEDLMKRAKELNQSVDDIRATRDADLSMTYVKYYQESLAQIKTITNSETDTIEQAYKNRLSAFDQYSQTAQDALIGLQSNNIITAEEYQKRLAEIEQLGVAVTKAANDERAKSYKELNDAKVSALMDTVNTELDILKEIGVGYEEYKNHRLAQIANEKQALIDKKVFIGYITEWEKQQLSGLADEYQRYLEQTAKYQESFQGQMDRLGDEMQDTIVNGFAAAFADAIAEGKNFYKSMQKLFKDLVKMILTELAKIAIMKAITAIFTGGGSLIAPTVPLAGNPLPSGGFASFSPSGMGSSSAFSAPTIGYSSADRKLDRLISAIENNKPQVYTQVIKGVPFYNAMRQAELEANVL